MIPLQFLDGCQYLAHLVRFGLAVIVLDIYSRIALPRQPIHAIGSSLLSRLAEVVIAESAQVSEANPNGAAPHPCKQLLSARHDLWYHY